MYMLRLIFLSGILGIFDEKVEFFNLSFFSSLNLQPFLDLTLPHTDDDNLMND